MKERTLEVTSNPILNSVRARLWRRNQNWLACLCGQTGTGKSYSALTIAKIIDRNFTADNVIFNAKDFIEHIKSGKARRGQVIVFDEAGVGFGARDWYTRFNKNLSYILQTFRFMNIGVIFTLPNFDMVDKHARNLFHVYMETRGINYHKRFVRLKWQLLQYNAHTHKLYRKGARVSIEGKLKYVFTMNVSEPIMELRNSYEKKKKDYLGELIDRLDKRLVKKKKPKKKTKRDRILKDLKEGKLTVTEIARKHNTSMGYVSQTKSVVV